MELTDRLFVDQELEGDEPVDVPIVLNPSSCFVQGRWDWTTGVNYQTYQNNVGRFTNRIQAYRIPHFVIVPLNEVYDYGYQVLTTRNKLRGNGKSLSLLFSAETGKDLHLYGWVLNFTVNNSV
jgi:hypothetical protein